MTSGVITSCSRGWQASATASGLPASRRTIQLPPSHRSAAFRAGFTSDDLGDHSFSWLTADEILAAPQPNGVVRTGIVTRAVFDKWDGHSQPES
jgi:hypothetical protein